MTTINQFGTVAATTTPQQVTVLPTPATQHVIQSGIGHRLYVQPEGADTRVAPSNAVSSTVGIRIFDGSVFEYPTPLPYDDGYTFWLATVSGSATVQVGFL